MTLIVKICGLKTADAVAAAVNSGADMVGFVFFPASPRHLTPRQAATLAADVPSGIDRVGVFVDPDDATLDAVLSEARLDMLQLHGNEPPERVSAVRERFGLPVIKAIRVAGPADLSGASAFDRAADWLMFDAREPAGAALPGGNGAPFDWSLLAGAKFHRPWLLSGGLDAGNVNDAVRISGAKAVDVSSGVEDAPGHKNPALIRAFLSTAKNR